LTRTRSRIPGKFTARCNSDCGRTVDQYVHRYRNNLAIGEMRDVAFGAPVLNERDKSPTVPSQSHCSSLHIDAPLAIDDLP